MQIVLIYIINISILTGISLWCYNRYKKSTLKAHYWLALGYKIICGLLLGQLFFSHYQSGDTITFFNQASELANRDLASLLKSVTEGTVANQPVRAIYFVRLLAIIKWLTYADYWMLSAYFSLFSFLGCAYLADKIAQWKSELAYPTHIAFLYYPSVVFWSSGLLKESLAFGALAFLLGTYFSWYQSRKLHVGNFFIAAIALLIIVFIKYYIAAALIPLLIYLALYHMSFWSKTGVSGIWKKTGLLMVMLALPVLLFLSWLSPNLSYSELWRVMQASHYEYIRLAPDGALHTLTWFGSNLDTVVNLPYLGFSGIFRPLIGEDMTFPAVLSSLENSVLLVAAVISFSHFFKDRPRFSPELLAVVIYISGLSIFLSYSAPNFGTLARFQIYYMPFVIMLVAYQLKSTKILSKD